MIYSMKRMLASKRPVGPFIELFSSSFNQGPSEGGFIFDHFLGHFMWEKIKNSARIRWAGDDRLDLALRQIGEDTELQRRGGFEPGTFEEPSDWVMGRLNLSAVDPTFTFNQESIRETLIAGQATTQAGVRFWWEGTQDKGESAVYNPIRIPATDRIRDDILQWAKEDESRELTRTKGVIFEERFKEVEGLDASDVESQLMDVHVKVEDVNERSEAEEIFKQAVNWTERATRQVT